MKTLVSPTHIKQEIRDYVRQERESIVDAVQRKAKENPLQMAAVAAAVAYPAFNLLRALPAPLWLIGAGLFLTSKRGREVAGNAKARVGEVAQQGAEKATDLANSVRSDFQDRMAGAGYSLDEAKEVVGSSASGLADKARAAFHDARESLTGAVESNASEATDPAERVTSTLSVTPASLKQCADEIARSSRYTGTDFVNNNALLVAGIGAVLGAVIAASIPPSEAENTLFGAGSKKIKEKAREAAAEGIEKAGAIAVETVGAVAAAAAREGLDASGVQGALDKVAEGVRSVADRGLQTALGSKRQSPETPLSFEQSSVERNAS
jgi:hypothetical protein